MQHYHLQEEFIDQAGEQALIAAVAHTPSLYFEFLDLLAPDVFAAEAAAWRQIALAIEADQPASLPAPWLPAPDRLFAMVLFSILRVPKFQMAPPWA